MSSIMGFFNKKNKEKVSSREKKEIINKAMKVSKDKNRKEKADQLKVHPSQPAPGHK